ncbi:hypothetical protein B0H19DRAFT_1073725 [Mycena capillaripes]|nr:hypothetical protein B0H19DRAFT_1073725 [Mycena capillaripes]
MSFNPNITLGPLLVATWANSVLYTVEVIQLLVFSVIALDSVSMIANYASVYLYQITHWGDLAYLQNQYWASLVAILAQGFLAARYWILTGNRFTTLTLFTFITVAAGGAFATGVTLAIFPKYKDREKVIIPATTWLVSEAVTDISIALALLLELRNVKSSFKETRSMVNRLVARTIQTGTAGATIALVVLVAFLANKESNGVVLGGLLSIPSSHISVPTGIAYCIGRIYCITMVRTPIKNLWVGGVSQKLKLANLNGRNTGAAWVSGGTFSTANPETRAGFQTAGVF